jgi:hypothetical protein
MPDLVENYMDYSSESCMNMFSQGQANHIRNVLNGPRNGLLQASSSTQTPVVLADRLRVLPNPVGEEARLQLRLEQSEQIICRLFSADGRLQWQSPAMLLQPGKHDIPAPVAQLTPGLYYLRAGNYATPFVKW